MYLGDVDVDLSRLADLCRCHQVRELSVFGSAARNQLRPDSRIDLLVEFFPEAEPGLPEQAGLAQELSEVLGRNVDLVSKDRLTPLIRDSILKEARPLYTKSSR